MRAALALSESQWYLFIDDDTVVRLPLAAAFASRYDWRERHAFGAYPCLADRSANSQSGLCSLRARYAWFIVDPEAFSPSRPPAAAPRHAGSISSSQRTSAARGPSSRWSTRNACSTRSTRCRAAIR